MKMSFQLEEGGSIAREVEVSISSFHLLVSFITTDSEGPQYSIAGRILSQAAEFVVLLR